MQNYHICSQYTFSKNPIFSYEHYDFSQSPWEQVSILLSFSPGSGHLDVKEIHCSISSQSLCDVLGNDVADDTFQAEVDINYHFLQRFEFQS